jgi:hypothetical protein
LQPNRSAKIDHDVFDAIAPGVRKYVRTLSDYPQYGFLPPGQKFWHIQECQSEQGYHGSRGPEPKKLYTTPLSDFSTLLSQSIEQLSQGSPPRIARRTASARAYTDPTPFSLSAMIRATGMTT